MADGKPIIIIKKKGGHGGHHGGAWKIAYADFVTAMMCFFMVMWLVNTADVVTKENIASYFRRPGIFDTGSGTPLMMGQSGILEDAFTPSTKFKAGTQGGKNDVEVGGIRGEEQGKLSSLGGSEEPGQGKGAGTNSPEESESTGVLPMVGSAESGEDGQSQGLQIEPSDSQVQQFQQAAQEIRTLVAGSQELQDLLGTVDVKLEADGLNIEIIDTDKTSMFQVGSARILPETKEAFEKLASIIAKLNNTVDIVGHTDSRQYAQKDRGYSNWELSADRANAARRILQEQGLDSSRISSVVGMADKLLKNSADPMNSSNRRISLKVRFTIPTMSDFTADTLDQKLENAKNNKPAPSTVQTKPEFKDSFTLPKETPLPQEQSHTFTPKEIIKAARKQHKDRIVLPDRNPNVPFVPGKKDKIFSDVPVIGPGDPFNF